MSLDPTEATLKKLFALSGNRCAYPSCTTPLVDSRHKTLIAQICHILGKSPGGPRHDPRQSDDQRRAFENLLLLCGPHHKEIDERTETWPAPTLFGLKEAHESVVRAQSSAADQALQEEFVRCYRAALRPYIFPTLIVPAQREGEPWHIRLDMTNQGKIEAKNVVHTARLKSMSNVEVDTPNPRDIAPGTSCTEFELVFEALAEPEKYATAELRINYSGRVMNVDTHYETHARFMFPWSECIYGQSIAPITIDHRTRAAAPTIQEKVAEIVPRFESPSGALSIVFDHDHHFHMQCPGRILDYRPDTCVLAFRSDGRTLCLVAERQGNGRHTATAEWHPGHIGLSLDGSEVRSAGFYDQADPQGAERA